MQKSGRVLCTWLVSQSTSVWCVVGIVAQTGCYMNAILSWCDGKQQNVNQTCTGMQQVFTKNTDLFGMTHV